MTKKSDFENHGLIIRCIREHSSLSVRMFAKQIGRSIGWVSEIENGAGTARISDHEMNRIIKVMDCDKHRQMFHTWVANYLNAERVDRTFDGAICKHIRLKKGLNLRQAAQFANLSITRLSMLERGLRPMTGPLRIQLMLAYGYKPSSFKNFSRDPERAKAVPAMYKLEILLKRMTESEIESVFEFAQEFIARRGMEINNTKGVTS